MYPWLGLHVGPGVPEAHPCLPLTLPLTASQPPSAKRSQQESLSLSPATGNQFLEESVCFQMFSFGDQAFRKNNGLKHTLSKQPND